MQALHKVINWKQATEKISEKKGFTAEALPDRYSIRSRGDDRELICSESPTIAVRVERGMSMPVGAVHKSPPGTIYLDGAAEGGLSSMRKGSLQSGPSRRLSPRLHPGHL